MGGWDQNGPRKNGWTGVDWIHLAQDRDCWWAVLNAVMNLWVLVPWSWLVSRETVYIKVADKSFENMANFKHLYMMIREENCIHEES
jgi:hypothetical protein